MAKFSVEQTAAVAAIQQVINEWGNELDENDGLSIAEADILSEDCRYNVGGMWREGRAAVGEFYAERKQRLGAEGGVPVMRHIMSNYRVSFSGDDRAQVGFLLLYFAATGTPPFTSYCDPLAVADVRMECRRDAAGEWRIAMFDSGQIFRRG
ncbi:MAG: nuclear transport factor 2 family protein [Bacteroidales bacterium]|nr:nuclear transport factor 2 family protein [Bacteroidales bacterium]